MNTMDAIYYSFRVGKFLKKLSIPFVWLYRLFVPVLPQRPQAPFNEFTCLNCFKEFKQTPTHQRVKINCPHCNSDHIIYSVENE